MEFDFCYLCFMEVDLLIGDCIKVWEKLGWKLLVIFIELVYLMVDFDIKVLEKVDIIVNVFDWKIFVKLLIRV